MLERDYERLSRGKDAVRDLVRLLDNKPFQERAVCLPALEALRIAAQLEGWLSELIFIIETDLIKE